MIVVTTEEVTGHRIVEMKGQVFGLVVRSRGLGGNIMAFRRSLGGGEIIEYTEPLEDARRHAVDRIVQNATAMGANAVIPMQYDSSEIGSTWQETAERFVDPTTGRLMKVRYNPQTGARDYVPVTPQPDHPSR